MITAFSRHMREITYVPSPLFTQPDADSRIESLKPPAVVDSLQQSICRESSTRGALGRLCQAAPLAKQQERYLFCRMNYLKFFAERLRRTSSGGWHSRDVSEAILEKLEQANAIRNFIVTANMRLVVSIAKRFTNAMWSMEELVSEATPPLIRAVELFDYTTGYRFSTYASSAIRHTFLRSRTRRSERLRRETVLAERHVAAITDACRRPACGDPFFCDDDIVVSNLLGQLTPRERTIVAARFGLGRGQQPATYRELGEQLGLSKERVRVLSHRAVEKLREVSIDEWRC
jgi:RNA polymerase sigma factor (sigma-70 family)